jgi:hypothetical protein
MDILLHNLRVKSVLVIRDCSLARLDKNNLKETMNALIIAIHHMC